MQVDPSMAPSVSQQNLADCDPNCIVEAGGEKEYAVRRRRSSQFFFSTDFLPLYVCMKKRQAVVSDS